MSGCSCGSEQSETLERKTLLTLLAINGLMFIVESLLGIFAESTGLIADSLDMFADATVYAISLAAVGAVASRQASAARLSGYIQVLLGIGVIAEVGRRLYFGSDPQSLLIILTGALALAANLTCLALIAKHRKGGVHMRASWIFSANDVLANFGVIGAGVLVYLSGSYIPDLIIGALISALIIRGGIRILKEAREAEVKAACSDS